MSTKMGSMNYSSEEGASQSTLLWKRSREPRGKETHISPLLHATSMVLLPPDDMSPIL